MLRRAFLAAFLGCSVLVCGCFSTENPVAHTAKTDKITSALNSSLKLVIKDDSSLKTALRAQGAAVAEFELKLIQHGNVSSPFMLMRKKAEISEKQATVTFSNIVPTSVIASLKLTGANVNGVRDFHAGIDLAPGENTLELVASGEASLEDVAVRAAMIAVEDFATMTAVSSALFENLLTIGESLSVADRQDPQRVFEAFKSVVTQAAIIKIAAGDTHSLVLRQDGTFAAFGSNSFGQLGFSGVSSQAERRFVYAFRSFSQVAAGSDFSLFLGKNGKVYAAGQNDSAQLGISPDQKEQSADIVEIPGMSDIVAIGAGKSNGFAIDSPGNLYAWGKNDEGQLGTGAQTSFEMPRKIADSVNSAAFGSDFCLVCKTDGTVWAAGNNQVAQMAADVGDRSLNLVQIAGLSDIIQVSAGGVHCLALDQAGNIYTWGGNFAGQTGLGLEDMAVDSPAKVPGVSNVKFIQAGNNFSLALTETNEIYGAGDGSHKQLGNISGSKSMVLLDNVSASNMIAAGGGHVLGFSGETIAWGRNDAGQVGNGQITDTGLSVPATRQISW